MPRVLVVEDDTEVRDWLAHCLLRDGHEVRGVADAAQARACAAEPGYRPDLILMDYALPDGDGVTLLEDLRAAWPSAAAVFVTVQWSGQVIERIEQTGCERVAKPFEAEALRAACRRALDRAAAPDGDAR